MAETGMERVARAIYYCDSTAERPDWTREPVVVRARYRCLARAAIEAMREPTEAMCAQFEEYESGGSTAMERWADGWRHAIDAAVKEEP